MDNSQKLEGTKLANFTPMPIVPELQIIDLKVGEGAEVPQGATITAHYTGALIVDGTIFQSSHDFGNPVTFPLNGVIPGWTQGVPGMKVGALRRAAPACLSDRRSLAAAGCRGAQYAGRGYRRAHRAKL